MKHERAALATIVAVTVVLAWRWLALIDHYAVNLFFSDHWYIYDPLFEGKGLASMFHLQHGPHRQGLGGAAIALLAPMTRWDSRGDSLLVLVALLAATVAALALKRAITGHLGFADTLIPVILLNISQIEAVVLVPNPAHGAIPVLLLLCVCLAFHAESPTVRALAFCLLAPLCVFTGFAMIAAPLLFVVVGLDLARGYRSRGRSGLALPLLELVALALSVSLFLKGYSFDSPGRNGSLMSIIGSASALVARFGAIEWNRFGTSSIVLGFALLLGLSLVSAIHLRKALKDDRRATSSAVFLLCGFPVLFALTAAWGRHDLGIQLAQSSRYMTLVSPGLVGLYLASLGWKHPTRLALSVVFALFVLAGSMPVSWWDDQSTTAFSERKAGWKDCVLSGRDHQACSAQYEIGSFLFPEIDEDEASEKLAYLKRHELNLFNGNARMTVRKFSPTPRRSP
jgi:hypothetical protein